MAPPDPPFPPQNIMPISAAMFSSERQNPAPQCPPRLVIQHLTPVSWSRMPTQYLGVESARLGERQGWAVECSEPLQMMALHIPEEDRWGQPGDIPRDSQGTPGDSRGTPGDT